MKNRSYTVYQKKPINKMKESSSQPMMRKKKKERKEKKEKKERKERKEKTLKE